MKRLFKKLIWPLVKMYIRHTLKTSQTSILVVYPALVRLELGDARKNFIEKPYNEFLEQLIKGCPHKNTYRVDDWEELMIRYKDVDVRVICRDCGQVIKIIPNKLL